MTQRPQFASGGHLVPLGGRCPRIARYAWAVTGLGREATASLSSAGTEAISRERPALDPRQASRPRRRLPRNARQAAAGRGTELAGSRARELMARIGDCLRVPREGGLRLAKGTSFACSGCRTCIRVPRESLLSYVAPNLRGRVRPGLRSCVAGSPFACWRGCSRRANWSALGVAIRAGCSSGRGGRGGETPWRLLPGVGG